MPTTFFLDYEGGNDANDGTTFANRWKTITNGATAARIAPGDTIRVMASPDPTSLGVTGVWTDGPLASTITSVTCTSATPIVCTKASHGLVTGDTVICSAMTNVTAALGVWTVTVSGNDFTLLNADGSNSVGGGGAAGTGGTFRKFTNAVVTLAGALTTNVACCGNRGEKTNWTASAEVTATVNTTDYKEGGECQQIAIGVNFATGLAAYLATGTLDLSSRQQTSFRIKQTSGTVAVAGDVSIRLCSDNAGVTSVHTATVPALGALNQWVAVTVDHAGAMDASIDSVAIYVDTDRGAQTFLIDNIIACNASSAANSLTHTSLISKDPGDGSYGDGYEAWFGIQSINGTRVVLEGVVNSIPSTVPQRGYAGTTETVTTYKRETTKTAMAASFFAIVQDMQEVGTVGNLTAYSGGWNRTDMSTQTGETWFDGQNGFGSGLRCRAFTNCDKINFARYYKGFIDGSAVVYSIGSMMVANTTDAPISCTGSRLTATALSAVCSGGAISPGSGAVADTIGRADSTTAGNGITLGSGSYTGTITQANNNSGNGVQAGAVSYIGVITSANGNLSDAGLVTTNYSLVGSVSASSNAASGIQGSGAGWHVGGGTLSGNGICGVNLAGFGSMRNMSIDQATEVSTPSIYTGQRVYSEKHDGTANNSQIFCDVGLISQQASVVHGDATVAWKFSPTNANLSGYYPLNLSITRLAVAANAEVTVSAWFQRSNTGLSGQLICKGGQISGVASDVVDSISAAADTWEQLTVQFTPTESGVIEIEAQFWGGSTYNGYVSDLSRSQA